MLIYFGTQMSAEVTLSFEMYMNLLRSYPTLWGKSNTLSTVLECSRAGALLLTDSEGLDLLRLRSYLQIPSVATPFALFYT